MAEQSPEISEGMSEEFNKDVDVKEVLLCDPCKDEGIHVKAAGFCIDCNDYLCTECHLAHKRSKLSRSHVLTNTDNIPKSKPRKQRKPEQCQEHPNKPISWYCKLHDTCICDICKHVNHRNCTEINSVTDVSQNFLSTDKLKQVTDRLTNLQKQFSGNLPRVRDNTEAVERHYASFIKEVIKHISKIKNRDLEMLKSLEVTCDITVKTISSLLNEIEITKHNGGEDQAFITTRKAESYLQAFGDRLETVENDNTISRYGYSCEYNSTGVGLIGKVFALKDRSVLKIEGLNVKTSTDTSKFWLTGMELLSDNRLVIADNTNYKIKLVDMTSKTVISELKLDWKPWDLTRIGDNMIAVTTYDNKNILFVSISDTLTVHKTIDKSKFKYCQGIVFSNNTLSVSYNGPNQIQILNLDGSLKQVIEYKDAHDTVRFGNVLNMTQGPDTNILYLTDWSGNKVTSMTLDGQVISSFEHKHLGGPRGITVGRDGQIIVCSYETNKIFEISTDLSEGRVILDENDGIKQPLSILYRDEECKLYVGDSSNNNSIQIFLI